MTRKPSTDRSRFGRALVISAVAAAVASPSAPLVARTHHHRSVVVAAIGNRIRDQQSEIDATRKRLDQKRGQLRFQQTRAQDLRRQLAETTRNISHVTVRLSVLDGLVAHNRRKLAFNQVQLDAAVRTLARHNGALRRRLVDAYERGDLGYVNVLLSSTSFNDFVERWDDIRYLIAANVKTVRERRSAERDVASARRSLESERAEIGASLRRQQQAKYQLAALAGERVELIRAADAQRRSVSLEVAQLENLSAEQEARLERYIQERQRLEAARRAAEAEARRRAAQLAGQQLPPSTDRGPGAFGWPASGPITDPFGMRMHPVTHQWRMHNGLDIGAPMGATITASAAGKIIYAGWEGGYGNTIIIDHGGAASTLYGHCSQLFVSEGQDVQRGQAIGAVGSTGISTGPHLHFEIRINGVAVDPSSRLQ
ncbi:MAG: peptidoglycan DD-metalloendopeptidase family protein [Vulcanimicrobiaceae bacterium]